MCRTALFAALGNVEILVGINEPDTAAYAALSTIDGVRLFVYPRGMGVGPIWNRLASEAKGDLLLMGNDDQRYVTTGWDVRFAQESARYPDGIFLMWCDDGINGDRHAAFPCVSRRWTEAVGRFVPESFGFFYHDTWLYDVAHRIGRLRYLPDVSVLHAHWTVGGVDDETTKANRRGDVATRDRQIWEATTHLREEDAARLRALMRAERMAKA